MATSQNGWPVYTSAPSGRCEWITGRVAPGDVETVFDYLGERFNSEVEKITVGHSWGWANRAIRGSSSTSNHASATAIDLNAPAHPLGKSGTFSSAQRSKIHAILSDLGGAIRWGGDYSGRKDEMHFEVNTSKANLAKVAASIRKGEKPKPVGGAPSGGSSSPTYSAISGSTPLAKLYSKGEPVKRIQKAVGVKVDSYFGPDTKKAVEKFQKARGLDVDGIVGKNTWAAINSGKAASHSGDPYPLPNGHFYYTEDKRNTVHSGYWKSDRPAIRKIQKKVVTGIDGGYGAKTKAAVIRWQKKNGVKADGAVGPSTWDAMFG